MQDMGLAKMGNLGCHGPVGLKDLFLYCMTPFHFKTQAKKRVMAHIKKSLTCSLLIQMKNAFMRRRHFTITLAMMFLVKMTKLQEIQFESYWGCIFDIITEEVIYLI